MFILSGKEFPRVEEFFKMGSCAVYISCLNFNWIFKVNVKGALSTTSQILIIQRYFYDFHKNIEPAMLIKETRQHTVLNPHNQV